MANNCADGVYTLSYTDTTRNPITVNKKTLIQNVLDITLLGKSRKEYGEVFDENILHLLENFSCPEDANNPGNPDFNQSYSNLLEQPTKGQLWFNSTQSKIFLFDGQRWNAMGETSDIGGNSGIIAHGQQLPRPISPITGYQFAYSECSWIVSPFNFPSEIDYMVCYTDGQANVTAQYRNADLQTLSTGYVFYQIIGIKDNNNQGTEIPVTPPIPSPTPLPNVSATPSPTPGVSATATPVVSPTPSQSATITPTNTPVPSVSATPTRTPPASPTPTVSPTPSIQPLRGTLFISPSAGYPNGTATTLPSSCSTTSSSDTGCFFTLSLIVQGLGGGTPPYTVDFTNVNFKGSVSNTSGGSNPTTALGYSYSGASGGTTTPVRTGALATTSLQMNAQISTTTNPLHCASGNWILGIFGGSFITITDSLGKVLTLYTPSGLNGNVYGTSYTTPQGDYTDSWFSTSNCPVQALPSGGGACVTVNSVLSDGKLAGSVNVNDLMATSDPYDFFETEEGVVTYAETKTQPCVRITTESGATLVCSTTAPIPTLDNGYMLAPTLIHRQVPVMRSNITSWEKVASVEFVGDREVRHITVGDRCFWAGETADAFILHHNKANSSDSSAA